ncbi:SAM-dependent methyltransferase [Salinimonas sediminis]|uniref:Class I SAM-dependent methyltransferase n=1 Tax=Salinimonas sediminis TaxID=2303538 RepID=A0A346NNS0_9ALTE|nr:cyclopropane-fatty-acyl-phospholipid synthase family protein [Salinimonas sediminis]AXR07177.1 class I SAM-dependent methyltransferase [Salinimonas sediminis]
MAHGETVASLAPTGSVIDKSCRTLFLKLMSLLPQGHMEIREQGNCVARYGNVDDSLKAVIDIQAITAYRQLLLGGSIAAGETYMDELWTTPDLTSVIQIFARNLGFLDTWEDKFKWISLPLHKIQHLFRSNTAEQAKKNIEAHYDLGNRLYTRFLDNSMMYSAAIYPDANASLAQAQQHKLRTLCNKLQLRPSDHLIEIGTGWGGLAVFAAKHYGCKVTTTTISEEQYAYASEWVAKENLQDQVTLLKKDYRELTGRYDKLVSIEMIEAVGKRYLGNFFDQCSRLLKSDGIMVLQSITIDDRRYESYANSVDFIQKYIFPGGFLPSQLVINQQLKKHSDMMIRDSEDIGLDYAKTLDDWYRAFMQAKEQLLTDGYDERFVRMWTYYLKYCEGGFLERTISTVQLVITKPACRVPIVRG